MKNNIFGVALICSVLFHLLIIYLFLFSTSLVFENFPEEQVVFVEMLPISSKFNIPNQTEQLEKAIENQDVKKVKQSMPDDIKWKKNINAHIKEDKPFEEKKEPIERKYSIEKKKKIISKNELDPLLKNLEQLSEGSNIKLNKQVQFKKNKKFQESKGFYDETLTLSVSEMSLIKQQIEKVWSKPIGIQNLKKLQVTLYIALNQDGSIKEVKVKETICPNITKIACDALSDSAIRAVYQASPINNLDLSRYNSWKEFNFLFNPSM